MIQKTPEAPLGLSPPDLPPIRIHGAAYGELDAAMLARSVLIIEDEAMIAWTLEGLLSDMGFKHIVLAASGADAIEQARRTKPGLILSDINLGAGEMDGIAAVAAIVDSEVAVVFITAYASQESRQQISRDLPRAAMLHKPIDASTLRHAITAVFARGKAH